LTYKVEKNKTILQKFKKNKSKWCKNYWISN